GEAPFELALFVDPHAVAGGTDPHAALLVRADRHDDARRAGATEIERREGAVVPAVEAAAVRADPDRALRVFAHGHGDLVGQTFGHAELLKVPRAHPHQPAAVQTRPDVAFVILKPAGHAVVGQAVFGSDAAHFAVRSHVQQ